MTKKRHNKRHGAITVEVALCLPVLILLLFGCYELARTNMILHGTQSAAYEGARTGIIPGATPDKIENSVGFVLRTLGVNDFVVETIPAVIQPDTEFVEVNVRVSVANNLSLPRLFVEDPTFLGTCRLKREIP
jgi:Flp pilus assembly protein TadG